MTLLYSGLEVVVELLVAADLFVTEGFCLTTDLSDLTSEALKASLLTVEETDLLVAGIALEPLTGLRVPSDPAPPET